jgi:hypothetical protein
VDTLSYVFEIGSDTVWSPALRVGEIYVGFVRVLEEVTGTSGGIEAISSDMVRIDGLRFRAFVDELLDASAANQVLRSEIETIVCLSLVMLERAGIPLPRTDDLGPLLARARTLATTMPV